MRIKTRRTEVEALLEQMRRKDVVYVRLVSLIELELTFDREMRHQVGVIVVIEQKHQSGDVVPTALELCVMLVVYVRLIISFNTEPRH